MDVSFLAEFPPKSTVEPRRYSSAAKLATDWPATHAACKETFFPTAEFARVDEAQHCQAGYMLAAVTLFERLAQRDYAHCNPSRPLLDLACSREIRYQFRRGRVFQKPTAALTKCLLNFLHERPERIFPKYMKGGAR